VRRRRIGGLSIRKHIFRRFLARTIHYAEAWCFRPKSVVGGRLSVMTTGDPPRAMPLGGLFVVGTRSVDSRLRDIRYLP
jgi:hypothetical protein